MNNGLYEIIDKQISYMSKVGPKLLDKFCSLYGKNCLLLCSNQQDNQEEDPYISAYGKNMIGFDFADKRYLRIPVKTIISYEDWTKVPTGIDMTIMLFLTKDYRTTHAGNPIIVQQGDIVSFPANKYQYYYRIDQVPDTYFDILFRVTMRMATRKDLDAFRHTEGERSRIINQPLNIPKDVTWYEENIEKEKNKQPIIPTNFGITGTEKYELDIPVPPNPPDTTLKRKVKRATVGSDGVIRYEYEERIN
jgi:hypothetical protein